jgi:hypothetical protein
MAVKKNEIVAAVTADRAQRLHRFLRLLSQGPQGRATVLRKLRFNLRAFYRDLEMLRSIDIQVKLTDGRYHLLDDLESALDRLPFPDPGLTLGEARQLARGRLAVHRKIKSLLVQIEGS